MRSRILCGSGPEKMSGQRIIGQGMCCIADCLAFFISAESGKYPADGREEDERWEKN